MELARTSLAALSLAVAFATAIPARAQTQPPETIEADVSTRSVAITPDYTGTEILIFGTVEHSRQPSAEAGTYDIVAVVEGMSLPAIVRRKSRVGGLWINTDSVRFSSFPSFYGIATTRPLDEIAEPQTLATYQIGFGYVRMVPSGSIRWAPSTPEQAEEYRTAAIRLKKKDRLFVQSDYGVTFRGRSLFRATISLPANVPVGPLTTRLFLFKDGKMLSQYKSEVMMERTGLERFLHDAAYDSPFLYGLSTVLVAGAAGLFASFAFRRGPR
ncbi:MAG: TIGR02186 family protein [Hyphomicrobiaceae bacterium]